MTPTESRNKRRIHASIYGLLAAVFLAIWVSSYRFDHLVGVDSESWERPGLLYTRFFRVRWPGDGSFQVGCGGVRFARTDGTPLQPFDLAGGFFRPPRPEPPRTGWNRIGFWWIRHGFDAPLPNGEWQIWAGVPGILPAFVFAGIAWRLRRIPPPRVKPTPPS